MLKTTDFEGSKWDSKIAGGHPQCKVMEILINQFGFSWVLKLKNFVVFSQLTIAKIDYVIWKLENEFQNVWAYCNSFTYTNWDIRNLLTICLPTLGMSVMTSHIHYFVKKHKFCQLFLAVFALMLQPDSIFAYIFHIILCFVSNSRNQYTECLIDLDWCWVKEVRWLFSGHHWPLLRQIGPYLKLAWALNQITIARISLSKSLIRTQSKCLQK